MSISEGQKIRLKSGEIGVIVEVFKGGDGYMAEVFKNGGGISVDTIWPKDINSVFVETEEPFATA